MSEPIPGSADAIKAHLVGKIERVLQAMADNSPPNSQDYSEIMVDDNVITLNIWEYGAEGDRIGQGSWRIAVQRVGP